jgi:hypothetical protein
VNGNQITEDDLIDEIGVLVLLKKPESFLLVKETLTRLGVASNRSKKLFQSAHILYRKDLYLIVHFKELLMLDGKETNISESDYARRNTISKMLADWNLLTILEPEKLTLLAPASAVKVLSHKDKEEWELVPKYTIGPSKFKGEANGNR